MTRLKFENATYTFSTNKNSVVAISSTSSHIPWWHEELKIIHFLPKIGEDFGRKDSSSDKRKANSNNKRKEEKPKV